MNVDREYFDALAKQMGSESNERLAERVKDGISAPLPGSWHPDGTEQRIPTDRQLHEAYIAAQELERRAGGKPEPVQTFEESFTLTDADLEHWLRAPVKHEPSPYAIPVYVVNEPRAGTMPEPDWWVKDDGSTSVRHPLTTEEEMVVELPKDATLKELEEKILLGMPSRGDEGVWHVPDAKELAEAKAALKVLVKRADG